jgi:hypothetical protein
MTRLTWSRTFKNSFVPAPRWVFKPIILHCYADEMKKVLNDGKARSVPHDPVHYLCKMLAPDPYWKQCGSETLSSAVPLLVK